MRCTRAVSHAGGRAFDRAVLWAFAATPAPVSSTDSTDGGPTA
jgi:hypothetical protein